jgi:peptidoglycan hydrolase-like protein with peptidoglycan-binding domain
MRYSSFAVALAAILIVAGASLVPSATAQTGAPAQAAQLSEETVRALQKALNEQGIAVPVDGILGQATYAAVRQYQTQHHLPVTGKPDAATLKKLGVAERRSEAPGASPQTGAAASPGGQGGMPGATGSRSGVAAPQGMMGPGMMGGQGQMPGMMGRMAGQGTAQGGMMPGMMGMQPGMMPMAPGGMGMMGMHRGHGMMGLGFGVVRPSQHLTVDDVRHHFEHRLEWMGNPRLKLGKVTEADEDAIVAEIVTVDGSQVDRLSVDRHSGMIQRAQ